MSRPVADSVAARVARHRASGVRVDAVLRDPAVIAAWRRLLAGRTVPEALALAIMAAEQVPGVKHGPA